MAIGWVVLVVGPVVVFVGRCEHYPTTGVGVWLVVLSAARGKAWRTFATVAAAAPDGRYNFGKPVWRVIVVVDWHINIVCVSSELFGLQNLPI